MSCKEVLGDCDPFDEVETAPVYDFKPNTRLYGRAIKIIRAEDEVEILGTLIRINGPHDYLIETPDGERRVWTVDSTCDLTEDEPMLTLWNAWR